MALLGEYIYCLISLTSTDTLNENTDKYKKYR